IALPSLYGGSRVWERADRLLAGTPAEAPARDLRNLYDGVLSAGLAPNVVVDLGETWSFAYYTGMLFQILAEGPGEAVGSGGGSGRLFERFGAPGPAAGFAIDLGNLIWALDRAGHAPEARARVLVEAVSGDEAFCDEILASLRRKGIPCAAGTVGSGAAY